MTIPSSQVWQLFSNIYLARWTRQGTPTPVAPDFSNLKARWATITPSSVAMSAYSAVSVTPRHCPSSTAGGWEADPGLPLATLGQVATPAPPNSTSSGPDPTAPHSPGSTMASAVSDGASGSATATTTTARGSGAAHFSPDVVLAIQSSVAGCVVGLVTVGLVVYFLL